VPWQALVLDEAHGLKNAGTARFRNIMELPVRALSGAVCVPCCRLGEGPAPDADMLPRALPSTWSPQARTRLLLTGTPVQNNVDELVSLLRWVADGCTSSGWA
jgi:hypothetical protein